MTCDWGKHMGETDCLLQGARARLSTEPAPAELKFNEGVPLINQQCEPRAGRIDGCALFLHSIEIEASEQKGRGSGRLGAGDFDRIGRRGERRKSPDVPGAEVDDDLAQQLLGSVGRAERVDAGLNEDIVAGDVGERRRRIEKRAARDGCKKQGNRR